MKGKPTAVDSGKRYTLKCLAAGASAAMVSLPSYAELTDINNRDEFVAIHATLVSIPGTTNETLILRNPSAKPLVIERFEQACISFDDETIDCGAVCNNTTIVIPPHDDVMVHFNSTVNPHIAIDSSNTLNVQSVVSRLPEGTRVIPLRAYMVGTAAVLLHA